jgi:mannose-6-phosphate isomerase-like protein (cupin superfamily)
MSSETARTDTWRYRDPSGRPGLAIVHRDHVRPVIWSGEETGRFLLRVEDTGGRFSYYEVTVPAGQGTLLHVHEDTDEMLHVVDGEFDIVVGRETHHALAGTVVYGPRGIPHAFRNVGTRPGALLCITTPGGVEQFFEELSDLLHEDPPAEWGRLSQLARRYRITALPAGAESAPPSPLPDSIQETAHDRPRH